MRQYILITLSFFIIYSCKNEDNRQYKGEELYMVLNDSLKLFDKVIETNNIRYSYKGENLAIECTSLSKDSFISAIIENSSNISFFNRLYSINEYYEKDVSYRNNSILRVGQDENFLYLKDRKWNDGIKRSYFLENRIGDYFIIKKREPKSGETILWDYKTGKENYIPLCITVTSSLNDSLVFYSSNFRITPRDATPICFLKLNSNKVDTVFNEETQWWAELPFFDCNEKKLYYIHSYYDDNLNIVSTYAKMIFEDKRK